MTDLLEDAGDTQQALNGEDAWQILQREGEQFSAILLDKMMPGISGVDLLKRIKATERLAFLPVIMQTAVGAAASVQESLAGGAFYYLTKPFSRDMLLAVVAAATEHWDRHQYFVELANQQLDALQHLEQASFSFRQLHEARCVTAARAPAAAGKDRHRPVRADRQRHRARQPGAGLPGKNPAAARGPLAGGAAAAAGRSGAGAREVRVGMQRHGGDLHFTISDQGNGFDWARYRNRRPDAADQQHGRGILIARKLSFDHCTTRATATGVGHRSRLSTGSRSAVTDVHRAMRR
jgi:CheY-like chemotaxis protein